MSDDEEDHSEFDKVLDDGLNAARGIINAIYISSHLLQWCLIIYILAM